MFQEFYKHKLMSIYDPGNYKYLRLPDDDSKSREVKQLA